MAWDAEAERQALIGRIRRRMKVLDWTNADLAKALGISPPHVRDILNPLSGTWLGGDKLIRCPQLLRCGYRWFFTGDGNESDMEGPPSQHIIDGYQQAVSNMEECLDKLRQRQPGDRKPERPGAGPAH